VSSVELSALVLKIGYFSLERSYLGFLRWIPLVVTYYGV